MSNNIAASQIGDKAPGWIWIIFLSLPETTSCFLFMCQILIALKEDDKRCGKE